MKQTGFHITEEGQIHVIRCRKILEKYPAVTNLMGRNPNTFLILLVLLVLQISIATYLGNLGFSYWWLSLIIAYFIGAFANHSLYVIIHEATHHLIFRNRNLNRCCAVLADLTNIVPGAMGFWTFHLKHHAHLGDYENDTDLATHWEAKLIGNASWRKLIWLLLFPVFQILRTFRLKHSI